MERVKAVEKVFHSSFGISTECGLTDKQTNYLESVFNTSATVNEQR